jgi:hypothetical protein
MRTNVIGGIFTRILSLLILLSVILAPTTIFIPTDVGDVILDLRHLEVGPEAHVLRDISFEPFALHQVEVNCTPVTGPLGEEVVFVEIEPYEGSGGKGIPFRSDSDPYNGTFIPQSSSYRVRISNYHETDTHHVNITITQIEEPLTFSIPEGELATGLIPFLLITTVAPLSVLFAYIFLKQRNARIQ